MDKLNTIFIDIDTQNDFLDIKGELYVPQSASIKRNLAILIDCAVSKNLPILSTLDTHYDHDPEFWTFKPHCSPKSWGWQKISETSYDNFQYIEPQTIKNLHLKLKSNRFMVEKQKISAFSNPNTLQLLQAMQKETCIVFGVATDFAVKEFTLGLLKENFKVQLVFDAIKGLNEFQAALAIQEMLDNGAELIKTREIISNLEQK